MAAIITMAGLVALLFGIVRAWAGSALAFSNGVGWRYLRISWKYDFFQLCCIILFALANVVISRAFSGASTILSVVVLFVLLVPLWWVIQKLNAARDRERRSLLHDAAAGAVDQQ